MTSPRNRQAQAEDETIYGPPSPSSKPRPSERASISHSIDPSTDELFLSESYPPSTTLHSFPLRLPFFNEKLDSPIGMGRGQPIQSSHPSNSHGSLERVWKRIAKILLEKPYQLLELVDTLSYPAPQSSLDSLQLALSTYQLTIPHVVSQHFLIHDGQDVFTQNSSRSSVSASLGIVWGLWLMSCEEVEAEWGFWRRFDGGLVPSDAFTATDFSSRPAHSSRHSSPAPSPINQPRFDQAMSSCPAGWVRELYSHPGWLPLLSDRVGNYIGVDLSPPSLSSSSSSSSSSPAPHSSPYHHQSSSIYDHHLGGGQGNARPEPGQVIAFGREIDQKVVLWRGEGAQGWANWLSSFADDLEDGKFARLIGRKLKKSKCTSKRRNSDGERGWSNSEDDSDETEDGLGDLGYFNDGTSFVGQDEDEDFHGWKLAPEYRGMSVIEALCARSKQRWAEVGSHSSRHNFSNSTESGMHSNSRQSPRLPAELHLGSNHHSQEANQSFSPEDNAAPGTPIAFVTPPSPRPAETDLINPSTPTSKSRTVSPNPSGSTSRSSPATGLQPKPAGQAQIQQPKMNPSLRRPRVPPPAPVSLDLPTMDSLMLEGEGHSPVRNSHHPQSPSQTSPSLTRPEISTSSSSSSITGIENRVNAPTIVSRLSMVGHRISEEMTRRSTSTTTSPVSARLPWPSRPRSASSAGSAEQKDMIGMVMTINENKDTNPDHHIEPITSSGGMPETHHSHFEHTHQHLPLKLATRPSGSDDFVGDP